MRLLLDTHIFLWVVADSRKLSRRARGILDSADAVFVSPVSIWEIAIKSRLGKMNADAETMARAIAETGFEELPVLARHAVEVAGLADHHRDPFDRLLIAQAISEPMKLITADAQLCAYSDLVMLV